MFKRSILRKIWPFACGALLLTASPFVRAENQLQNQEEQKIIQQNLNDAFNAYISEDFEKALGHFQKVLQIDPYEAAALKGVKLCRKKLQRGAVDRMKAEEQKLKLSKKLIRDERWLDAIDNLKDISNRPYQQTEALKLLSEAEVLIRKKISQAVVGSGDYLAYQGILFYMNRRYAEALKVWREAEQISSENLRVSVYIQRVEQFYQESHQAEAEQSRKLAQAACESENYEECARLWKKILELNPQDDTAPGQIARATEMLEKKSRQSLIGEIYDRAQTLYQEEKYADSLVEWKRILEIDSSNEVAIDYVAKIEKTLGAAGSRSGGQPAVSKSTVSVAATSLKMPEKPTMPLTKKPAGTLMNYDEGIGYYNSGKYQKAVEFFDLILRTNPDDAQAREWLNKSVKDQNEAADKHYRQGVMAYSLGNVEEAIREWQASLEIYPNHVSTKRALSKVGAAQKGQ